MGCAPGATGGVIGELVASWCADATGYDQLKIDAGQAGADAALVQRCCEGANTMTELKKRRHDAWDFARNSAVGVDGIRGEPVALQVLIPCP
jgi:hypothetical protein